MSVSTLRRLVLVWGAIALNAISLPAMAQNATQLHMIWEVTRSVPGHGTDYMSTFSTTERDAFPSTGAIFYLPLAPFSGSAAVNRLYDGGFDHMDSGATSEGSYSNEGALGYGWTSSTAIGGLAQFARLSNGSDHVGIKAGDIVTGYGFEDLLGIYGFPRYHTTTVSLNSLSAGGVTIGSNSVAGGSLWSWVWNGIEFVDHLDFGREIQAAVFWGSGTTQQNPTEAGSKYTGPAVANGNSQGAPVIQNSNSGNTQSTRSIPLEFQPELWSGGPDTPVAFLDMVMGKDITLNYNSMGPVAKYDSIVNFGSSVSSAEINIIAGYMPTSFSRFYTYDAPTQTLTEVFPGSTCEAGKVVFQPSYGALIIANSNGTAAMGVYGKGTAVGGHDNEMALYKCSNTNSWQFFDTRQNYTAGNHTYTHFITTDTLTNVVANVRTLYMAGAL